MIRGLDVSWCQGVVDWARVPKEFRFVVVKATEGLSGADPNRMRNLQGAKASGRLASWYHFLRPGLDAKVQIANLWRSSGDTMPDFRPALDLESAPDTMTPDDIAAWFVAAAEEAERYFGVPPLVYTYPWFFNSRIAKAKGVGAELGAKMARCPLWMADYSKGEVPHEDADPYVPIPWRTWTMWQTSGDKSGRVPGIYGAVDHDVFNGTEEDLVTFRGLPTAEQLEPEAPIIHLPVYGWTDSGGDPPDSAA